MSFTEAVKTCFAKYVTFSGRARRSEHWYFFLFITLIQIVLYIWLMTGIMGPMGEFMQRGGDPQDVEAIKEIFLGAITSPACIALIAFSLATLLPMVVDDLLGWKPAERLRAFCITCRCHLVHLPCLPGFPARR